MKKSLFTLLIGCLVLTSVYSQTTSYLPTNDLVAWYPFNGNANDMSGNGHHGLVFGANLTTDINGNPNSAYSFDGIDDRINCAPSLDFELYDNRTLSVWIYSNVLPNDDKGIAGYISTSGPTTGHTGYLLLYRGYAVSNLIGAMEDAGPSNVGFAYTNVTVFANNWHHLVHLRQNGITYIYLNGVLQTATTTVIPYFNSCEFIMGYSGISGQYFDGKIDDVALWNRALSAQEITDIFSGTFHVGVNEVPNNTFVIYPNPTVNEFYVEFQNNNKNKPASIDIYDMTGKLIENKLISNNISDKYKFDISALPKGTYLVKVVFENGESSYKIINKL